MNEIPRKVKIDGLWFTVVEVEKPPEGSVPDYYGKIDYDKQTIRIHKVANQHRKIEILLHEILHAVCNFREIDISEKNIQSLSHGVYAALEDNCFLVEDVNED